MQFTTKNSVPNKIGAITTFTIGLIGLALLAGCPKSKSPGTHPGEETSTNTKPKAEPKPLLADWASPKAVLIFSGDEHGYLEPCGCSEKQSGGFARRADLIRQLQEEKQWHVTGLNVGGLLRQDRVHYPQSKIKFKHMLTGLNQMGFQGMALGLEELLLGTDELYTQNQNLAATEGFDLPFLAENVTFYGTKDLGTPIGSRILEVGSAKIGVIGITGASTKRSLQQTGLTLDDNVLKIDPPVEAIQAKLEELKAAEPDLLVLLSHSEIDESEALAKAFPEFQVAVTANSAEDPRQKPDFVGETMIVQVGKKGKNVVAVGLFEGGDLKHELIELDMDRFDLAPSMHDLMQAYQNDLQENYSQLVNDSLAIDHPSDSSFAGAKACAECHTYAFGIWSKTKHSHALESLRKGRPNYGSDWVDRVWDPECLACHTTGWDSQAALRYKTGFLSVEESQHLAGNQCENCHGPASVHVELEKAFRDAGGAPSAELIDNRKALKLLKGEAEQKVCVKCHDYENSPKFNFQKYWKEVNHSGTKN